MKDNTLNWQELKYGMFIHFGLFTLCGGIWKGEKITKGYSEQILSHGDVCQNEYESLVDQFSIEKFSAKEIVTLAKESKMQYIVLVTKHHDGYCLFDTKTTTYSTMHSACKKDIVKELSQECKKQGLKFGIYFSWIDWHFKDAMPISLSNSDIIPDSHQELNILQLTELLTNYGEICELWMDMGAPNKEQSKQVYELAHSLQPNIMVNGRVWNDYGDFLTLGDNEYPCVTLDMPWQTPATIYHETWGYREYQVRDDKEGKIKEITDHVTSVLNQGGNYLLNIGPYKDGSVLQFEKDILLGVAKNLPSKLVRNIEKPVFKTDLDSPISLYRYTGHDYYSYKPILTGYKYNIKIEKDGKYKFSWTNPTKLDSPFKLCLSSKDKEYYFSLKQNDSSADIVTLDLKKGEHTFILHTVGTNLKRSELKCDKVKLCMSKV